jgi:hypothetical protein
MFSLILLSITCESISRDRVDDRYFADTVSTEVCISTPALIPTLEVTCFGDMGNIVKPFKLPIHAASFIYLEDTAIPDRE